MKYTIEEAIAATQEYLRTHSLEEFEEEKGIQGKTDGYHTILNYNMTECNWSEPYGYVCRGLVLDAKTYEVLGFGLAKFWNDHEGRADTIDWNSAIVYDKLDGTMMQRWWSPHLEKFCVTTRYQLPGDMDTNTVGLTDYTWAQLFEEAITNSGMELVLDCQSKQETFFFEVCSWHNQIVVYYPKPCAFWLGMRDNIYLQEEDVSKSTFAPKTFDLTDQMEVQAFALTLDGREAEGFVVVDKEFNRIKIKAPSWHTFSKLSQGLIQSWTTRVEVVQQEKVEKVLTTFPHLSEALEDIQTVYYSLIDGHNDVYQVYKDVESQKEFALAIQQQKLYFPNVLFQLRAGKIDNIKEGFTNMRAKRLADVIGNLLNIPKKKEL